MPGSQSHTGACEQRITYTSCQRLQKINLRPTWINTDVTNRQADNQLHPETFPVTYQKVPSPDFAKKQKNTNFKVNFKRIIHRF